MTVTYTHWAESQPGHEPYTRLSPRLAQLQAFLLWVYGGQSLTSNGVDIRPIRDGQTWSAHAFGAALDWRYANVGGGRREVGREAFLSTVLPFLIEHADALQIQQIHDYVGCRIWRTGRGWKAQPANPSNGMGQAWAEYTHIEVNAPGWADGTPIDQLLGLVPDPNPTDPNPPFDPEGTDTVTILNIEHATLKRSGARTPSRHVARFQAILGTNWGAADIVADGLFGPKTEQAVINAQRLAKLTPDGIIGPQTATVLLSQ
jgi:hypothetical protein